MNASSAVILRVDKKSREFVNGLEVAFTLGKNLHIVLYWKFYVIMTF